MIHILEELPGVSERLDSETGGGHEEEKKMHAEPTHGGLPGGWEVNMKA